MASIKVARCLVITIRYVGTTLTLSEF